MSTSSLSLRAGEVTALLHLAALDARIRQAERVELEIVRQLNEHRVGMETLARFIEDDRSRLVTMLGDASGRARIERAIDARHQDIGRLAEALELDRRRAEPALDRLHQTLKVAQTERERLLQGLDRPLLARYESLVERGTLAFIVPVRDGRCAGCSLVLSAALLDSVQRPDVIGACPRCERLLYGRRMDT